MSIFRVREDNQGNCGPSRVAVRLRGDNDDATVDASLRPLPNEAFINTPEQLVDETQLAHHMAARFDLAPDSQPLATIFVDGAVGGSVMATASAQTSSAAPTCITIGGEEDEQPDFDILLDEVRISHDAHNDTWIEWEHMAGQTGFVSLGSTVAAPNF